jgi:hypothetical protein
MLWIDTFGNGLALLLTDIVPAFFLLAWFSPLLIIGYMVMALFTWTTLLILALMSKRRDRLNWRSACAAGLVVVTTIGLSLTRAPGRIAFWSSLAEFEVLRANARDCGTEGDGEPLGQFIGGFYVDRYGADGAGGVFFRTAVCLGGSDYISSGFAYRPHQEGCPFGRAEYHVVRLMGDWYWFSASHNC